MHRDADGNVLQGGQQNHAENTSNEIGKKFRNAHQDEIQHQGLIRPTHNWYQINNRTFEE